MLYSRAVNLVRISHIAAVLLVFAIAVPDLEAQTGKRSIRVNAYGLDRALTDINHQRASRSESDTISIDPVAFSFSLPRLGRVQAVFDERKVFSARIRSNRAHAPPSMFVLPRLLLQGRLLIGRPKNGQEVVPAALDIIGSTLRLRFLNPAGRRGLGTSYTLRIHLGDSSRVLKARVSRRSSQPTLGCGARHQDTLFSKKAGGPLDSLTRRNLDAIRLLHLDLVSDAEWFAIHGANSAAQILAHVNAADSIYRRDFWIGLVPQDIVILTANPPELTSTDKDSLLSNFEIWAFYNPPGGTRVTGANHLFTGKTFGASGTAYLDTVCTRYAVGITRNSGASTYLVLSHEIGHTFGLNHSTDGGIMNAVMNHTPYFSAASKAALAATLPETPLVCLPYEIAPPVIAQQPRSTNVAEGLQVTMSVIANGSGPFAYQWQKNNSDIPGATAANYSFTSSAADSGARFRCRVANNYGEVTSLEALLTVTTPSTLPPSIISHPQDLTVPAGGIARFSVTANGSGVLSYQWYINRTTIIPGATSASYSFTAQATDEGKGYYCYVTNSYGESWSLPGKLSVSVPVSPPQITEHPDSQTVNAGQSVTFSVSAGGSGQLSYQWQRDNSNIAGATSPNYTFTAQSNRNGAAFRCRVSNATGSVFSNAATLTVAELATPPSFLSHPQSLTAVSGSNVTFNVSATGSLPRTLQWQRNNVDIPGATTASYSFVAQPADNGATYRCRVSNSGGTAYSNGALLTVTTPVTPPAISSQPANKLAYPGMNVVFNIIANGSAPLTYQWQRNGIDIPGAISSVYSFNTSAADKGAAYRCRVSNSAGMIYSNSAVLTVVLHGDYNRDGCVTQLDKDVYRAKFGTMPAFPGDSADGNWDGRIDAADSIIVSKFLGQCE